ncbi:uncharacterized protein LOC114646132 [Erpetoichthys calabaricus]|uniref:Uncharacterized LOC114646132 n=1 Tax=Erpetoichthys calabaricus TaxID=27687 RepID=A0A8C4T0Q2_ERPCA|nr:uncharacterized protein LOC114646132 [Erpetoichthys calabaricus]
MSLSYVKTSEQVTITVKPTSTENACPLICQLCYSLCCSSFCHVSKAFEKIISGNLSTFGAIQIMVGMVNIAFGLILRNQTPWLDTPHWAGSVFIVVGCFCFLADKFHSPCMVLLCLIKNIICTGCAVANIVLLSIELPRKPYFYCTTKDEYSRWPYRKFDNYTFEVCQNLYHSLNDSLLGIKILYIAFGTLHLCITISIVVLTIKALCIYRSCNKPTLDDEDEVITPLPNVKGN